MERRTLLAALLAFVVLYVYQTYVAPPSPQQATHTASVTQRAPSTSSAASQAAGATAGVNPVDVGVEDEFTLENSVVRAVFTNRGGRLKSWVLKNYIDSKGVAVDLVARGLPDGQALPLSIEVEDASQSTQLNQALYAGQVDASRKRVVFTKADAAGMTARKEFELDPSSFVLSAKVTVSKGERSLPVGLVWGPGLGDLGATTGGGFFSRDVSRAPEAILYNGSKVERVSFADVTKAQTVRQGAFKFLGVDDHYFIAAALAPGSASVAFTGLSHVVPESGERQRQLVTMVLRAQDSVQPVRFYIGPKAFDVLKAVDPEFVRAINFGFWSWLAVPFLGVLKWIYGFAGNWGWSIIALTILMNIVIFPLRHKTAISMRKMQEVQPQMKAIQDRYAGLKTTDPARQKMNAEIMALYKEKGANPVSGCIPTLLTFPLLFAFYSLLSESIELRSAPFALWIRDLSVHDPYFVTPILMGGAMLWQQWMTPATGDPAQRKMMMFMPVVFVGMFLTLPSGLAIYYFVNTIWGIGQQYFTNWILGPPVVQTPRPSAERRVKSVGSGRTESVERKS